MSGQRNIVITMYKQKYIQYFLSLNILRGKKNNILKLFSYNIEKWNGYINCMFINFSFVQSQIVISGHFVQRENEEGMGEIAEEES